MNKVRIVLIVFLKNKVFVTKSNQANILHKDEVTAYETQKKEAEAKGQKLDSNTLVRPRIKLSSCLESFGRSEIVEQFYSSALNEKTAAHK